MKVVLLFVGLGLGLGLGLGACKSDAPAAKAAGAGAPPQVGVITLEPRAVTLSRELPGRTSAFRIAEVRARANGIIQRRLFTEGSDVAEGAPLFKIDPAPYQAALDAAQAQLARAEATVEQASTVVERYEKLIVSHAISQQERDDAVAKLKTAKADVAAARAAVKTARINLDYTTAKAPIAGRIGRAEVTEGAFVQASQATLLATIQQLDKLYVDLTWSTAEVMRMRRAIEAGELQGGAAKVTLVLDDGREYPIPGTLQFADVSVDQTTGSVSLRATIENPKQMLLPGMFVRARIDEGTKENAILVPQKGVTRDPNGAAVALVVDKQNKVERRKLVTDRAIGDSWLVTSGLAPGDQVIIDGIQKVRPGAPVTVIPSGVATAAVPAQGSAAPQGAAVQQGSAAVAPPAAPAARGSGVQPATKTTEN